ncbi:hypothetical protein PAPHI01_2079 [Pancytospora philotis]|nr:hypothetical protein PAPHI01_2079 [Pancytospora philotis]
MTEQIEADRKLLMEEGADAAPDKKSYIPELLADQPKLSTRLKIHNLSTVNILNYVDESFNLGDKYVLKRLDAIREELLGRRDLFEAALLFLKNSTVRSSLYYWIPGFKINNVFSFIKQLIPGFVEAYRAYYARSSIIGEAPLDCLQFIKEHFEESYNTFLIMAEDLLRFESCISLAYWSSAEAGRISADALRLAAVAETLDVSPDIRGTLVPELSFAVVAIGARELTVTLSQLDGLISNAPAHKEFWAALGVVDDEWNLLP